VVNFFVQRWSHAVFCWSCAVGFFCWAFAVFCLSGGRGNVLLSSRGWLTFLFNVGLTQCFVGVALSDFSAGLSQIFV
jgi:hypothetical protein